jgi:hypothetical protein
VGHSLHLILYMLRVVLTFAQDNKSHRTMTLRDEALYTEEHEHWAPKSKLRYNQVSFVKAVDGATSEQASEDDTFNLTSVPKNLKPPQKNVENFSKSPDQEYGEGDGVGKGSSSPFVVDITGTPAVVTGLSNPIVRVESPSSLDSEEEVIFKGRNYIRIQGEIKAEESAGSTSELDSVLCAKQKTGDEKSLTDHSFELRSRDITVPKSNPGNEALGASPKSSRHQKKAYPDSDPGLDDEAVEDYLANIRDYKSSEQDPQPFLKPKLPTPNPSSGFAWGSDYLRDLGDLSTSSKIVADVGRIYSRRTRPTGVQYLVVGKGLTPDDARWIRSEWLTSPDAIEQIRTFEESEKQVPVYPGTADESTSSDFKEGEDWNKQLLPDKKEELSTRAMKRMTDEQIARRLQKQADLGLDVDQVLMYNGEDDLDSSESEVSDIEKTFIFTSRYTSRRLVKRSGAEFPHATAFADALTGDGDPYNGFDVMDRNRPSLTPKSKKKLAQLDLELSDVELEATLQSTWEKDRQKKKSRKQEREELRSIGLFGRKSDKKAKSEAVEVPHLDDVKAEIKEFYLSGLERYGMNSMPLPRTDCPVFPFLPSQITYARQSIRFATSLVLTRYLRELNRIAIQFFSRLDAPLDPTNMPLIVH